MFNRLRAHLHELRFDLSQPDSRVTQLAHIRSLLTRPEFPLLGRRAEFALQICTVYYVGCLALLLGVDLFTGSQTFHDFRVDPDHGTACIVFLSLYFLSDWPVTWMDEVFEQIALYTPINTAAYAALNLPPVGTRAANDGEHHAAAWLWWEQEIQALDAHLAWVHRPNLA